jgi:DNA-binding CsgD family transcriptional regulator
MPCATNAPRSEPARPLPESGRSPVRDRATTGQGWRIPVPRADGTDGRSRPLPLNPRDREVLRQLAAGRSTAQIARALSVSSNTARTRIRRVSAKLAVTGGRHDAVDAARVLGLV